MPDPLITTGVGYLIGGIANGLKVMKDNLSYTCLKTVEFLKVKVTFNFDLKIDYSKLMQAKPAETVKQANSEQAIKRRIQFCTNQAMAEVIKRKQIDKKLDEMVRNSITNCLLKSNPDIILEFRMKLQYFANFIVFTLLICAAKAKIQIRQADFKENISRQMIMDKPNQMIQTSLESRTYIELALGLVYDQYLDKVIK